MTWQLGALTVLSVALVGGFAWYERTRPDARIVALVATLAAFAALGRIAFAALPNVKPTTDIVLIAGYALGPAPGFVVGALTGLTSNFFFGQGPWTPWQMVGWGAAGLLGAGLATATRGRAGRWPLALLCALTGFAFTVFQDIGDWVTYSDHSPAQLGVYTGKGLGFDAVHAAGCLAFALAFGPALVRSLVRFAARSQVTWREASATPAALLAVVFGLGVAAGTRLEAPPAAAHSGPLTYLLGAENADGGFGSAPGAGSTQLVSGWAALGLEAEGYNPARVGRAGHTLLSYLGPAGASPSDPGAVERQILVAAAAGASVTSLSGHDLLAALERDIGPSGSVSGQSNLTAFAILALRAAGHTPPARTTSWLIHQADGDGGFNYATAGGASDPDDTGAALEALAAAPGASAQRARARAVTFLERWQNRDGGFAATEGGASNAQSTAWAVQGLLAAGVDPSGLHRRGAPSPLAYLGSLIAPDGHIRYSRSSDQTPVWVTAEAIMALAGKPLPLSPLAGRRVGRHRSHTRPGRNGVASARRRHGAARRGLAGRRPGESAALLKLAADAGIIDALALAPVGVG